MLRVLPENETRFWGIFRCLLLPAAVISLSLCIVMALATAFGENAPVFDGREVRGLSGVLICLAAFPFVMFFGAFSFTVALYFDRRKVRKQ